MTLKRSLYLQLVLHYEAVHFHVSYLRSPSFQGNLWTVCSMEPECNFWGVRIPPGESVEVAPEYKEDWITSVHLTQVALGDKPKAGGHTIFVEKEGEKFALGTLDRERCMHFSLDIHLATDAVALSHTGKSDVYLTGYEAVSIAGDEEPGFPGMHSDDEMGSEEESEEEEEEAPRGVPIPKADKGRLVLVDGEAEESSDEEGDSGEEEEDSEEEGADGLRHSEEEGESGEEEESDDDEEEEESESEEEAPQMPPPKAQAGAKRPAKQPPAATPQPPKKSKGADAAQKAAPATAPPKVPAHQQEQQQAAAQPSGSSDYLAALQSHLASKGPTKLAALGSAVKRPPKVAKLKHFLDQHKAVFKYDQGTDTVSLA